MGGGGTFDSNKSFRIPTSDATQRQIMALTQALRPGAVIYPLLIVLWVVSVRATPGGRVASGQKCQPITALGIHRLEAQERGVVI